MNDRRNTRAAKRVRIAAGALTAMMLLPGLAVADHTTCTPGALGAPGCQAFNPQLVAGAQVAFTDSPSSISFRFNQKDHDQPVIGATYLAPKGWQFALNTLRQAQISEGPATGDPATDCSQVIIGEENDHDDEAAFLGRADNLAGGTGMSAWFTDTSGIGSRVQVKFGYVRGSRGGNNPSSKDPSISFLSWDGTTARFCMYHYANDFIVDHVYDTPDGGFTGVFVSDDEYESSREHIVPVTMTRIAPGELLNGEDISLNFGWKISFDLKSVYEDPFLFEHQTMISDHLFYLDAISGGNWNINPVTGKNEQIVFSKTPKAAGTYEFRAIFDTCSEGLQSPGPICKNTDGNPADDVLSTVRSVFQKILPPPSAIVYDFGKLTGPKGSLAPVTALQNFGVIRGTPSATFTWNQPPVAPTETVKGYLLTVAVPGQQNTRHFEYMLTNPLDLGFDTRAPCGADGKAAACSVTLTFPLSTVGPNELDPDGKYNVSLVTLYEGQGTDVDFRSDGLCDDGVGFGVDCPVTQSAFRITGTGFSTWQLLMRSDAWPQAYVQTEAVTRTGGGPSFTAPLYVLLVDFAKKRGQVVVWNAVDGAADVYAATSQGIIGDNGAGGIVSFFSPALVGHAVQFRFDGVILPAGNAQSIGGFRPFAQAQGLFLKYDLKGLPGAIPPGGLPSVFTRVFQAAAKI